MAAFTQSVCFRLKLLRALETAGQKVLTYTLLCGTPGKATTETLVEYLARLPDTSTAKYKTTKEKGKCFDKTQKHMIRNDTTCMKFDISLLNKAITVACEGWDDTSGLARLVKKIKDTRNEVVHEAQEKMTEQQFLNKLYGLRDGFLETLEATKVKYNTDGVECDNKKDEVEQLICNIRDERLSEDEILMRSLGDLLPDFHKEGNEELKQMLDRAILLDPLCFLSGRGHHEVNVKNIFSEIEIKKETKDKEKIHYTKLLTLAQNISAPSRPHLILLEGDAGSGKTTFVTYTLSEYLNESDRRMAGLDTYNLLLWVVCREETSDTLESLLESLIPCTYSRYGKLLMPLLKHSKVLIVIDGLDEMDERSRLLVRDVLRQARDCPKFTLLSTSRPETIEEMKAMTPKEFKIIHLRLEGISVDMRTDLALSHYRWLCGTKPGDEDHLRQIMDEIAWKEIFKLPLNILFLVTFFYKEPSKLTTNVTQTELYRKILDWCVEKLRQRLAGHQGVPKGPFLKMAIEEFLRESHKIALKGLLERKIYLSDDNLKELACLCKDKGLPLEDTLQAFYSLRRVEAGGATIEKYRAPHKGLQDFLAACHIHEHSIDNYRSGDIRKELVSMAGQHLQLEPLRNMLSHLLGLLSRGSNPNVQSEEETVILLQESGIADTDDWLSVLADTEPHPDTIRRVASFIGGRRDDDDDQYDSNDDVTVSNGTVHIAARLLPLISRREVNIDLMRDHSRMGDLFAVLHHHKLTSLYLEHHLRHPRPGASSVPLLQQVPCHNLWAFMGQLDAEHLKLLPKDMIVTLHLSVAGDSHAKTLLPALEHIRKIFPRLKTLRIHVPVTKKVTPSCLTRLPEVYCELQLSCVMEVGTAVAVAAALCPTKKGYKGIKFPGAKLGASDWEALLRGMKDHGVKTGRGIVVPETTITDDERSQLNTLARSLLGCKFRRDTEEWLWS